MKRVIKVAEGFFVAPQIDVSAAEELASLPLSTTDLMARKLANLRQGMRAASSSRRGSSITTFRSQ